MRYKLLGRSGLRVSEIGDDHMQRLDQASAVDLGFPHDFVVSPMAHSAVFGETFDAIDSHR